MDELLEKLAEGKQSNGIIKDVLDNTLKEAKQLFSQIGKAKCLCTVCGKEVRFLPPSPYKRVMREHFGYTGENINFLFEGEEDRCPVCGAPEDVSFLLGFMEDIKPEGNERLKICCMEVPETGNEGIREWIKKYASIKEYLEYVSLEDADGNIDGRIDVVICKDILEQIPDDSEILERIYRFLKDDGVCVVMVSAFFNGDGGITASETGEEPASERNVDRWRKLGLEGICRIYSKEMLVSELEAKGFEVNTADEEWFGKEYYEQCGFGQYAQLLMLTKK